jgi:hypothetical protein
MLNIPRSRKNIFCSLNLDIVDIGSHSGIKFVLNFELFASFHLMLSLLKAYLIRMKPPLIKLQLIAHAHIEFFLFELLETIFINILLLFYQADQRILAHFI